MIRYSVTESAKVFAPMNCLLCFSDRGHSYHNALAAYNGI